MMRSTRATRLAAVRAAAVVAFLVTTVFAARGEAADAYTLQPFYYGMQLKTPDGRVVLDYMTKKPEGIGLTTESVACFHPVNTPSGVPVTAIAPDDHRHHRAMYLAFHTSEFLEPSPPPSYPRGPVKGMRVTRADFWGWDTYAPRTGRRIATREIRLVEADANHALLEIRNDWMVNNRKMLDEVNLARVSERDGVYVIDLEYRLTPVADYHLLQSGFGGFNFQARKDGEIYFANSKGKVELPDPHFYYPESNWPAAPWYDYTIKLKTGETVGAAVIDHPKNPPTSWQNSTRLWMLNPSITGPGPVTIKKDTTLTLRYRVVVHDGETPTAVLEKLAAEWRQ